MAELRYFTHDITKPETTDTVVAALKQTRVNNFVQFMATVYAGASPELYVAPDSAKGPWETRVYYGLDGFDHSYTNGDADLAFDRIIMTDGFVRMAWNFKWGWETDGVARLVLLDSYWYLDAGTGRGYDYLGHMDYLYSGTPAGYCSNINWDETADPHDAPGTEDN